MPLIVIHGNPPVDRPDAVHALKVSVVTAARSVDHIELAGKRFLATCPVDRDTLNNGETVIVQIQGLFDRPSRIYKVRKDLCEKILEVVREWTTVHLPQCTYIEVLLDHPYNKSMGHAEWRRDNPKNETTQ